MSRPNIFEPGKQFKYFTLLEKTTEQEKHGNFLWKCQCKCGNIKFLTTSEASNKSCGCAQIKAHESTSLVGKKFGRLLVTERLESNGRNRNYLCRCDCGKEKIMLSGHIGGKSGAKSCGCLAREYGIEKLEEGVAAFNSLYITYKNNASSRRNLSFEISKDFFKSLTKMPCFYCGQEPNQVCFPKYSNGSYTYNGIDRINSNIGYIESNCVPCCGTCNRMKMALNKEEFVSHIKKIHFHLNPTKQIS